MKGIPKISETEWEVMRVVWDHHPLTAAEVIQRLTEREPSWHPKTVRTLLGRLVHKRALKYEAQGRAYVYEPGVSESECIAAASESFLDRVFGGSLKPMLAHFVERQKLTREDLEELSDLLERGAQKRSKSGRKTWKR
jgi:BlaI family transcriptional regulator, penicillinase repressor